MIEREGYREERREKEGGGGGGAGKETRKKTRFATAASATLTFAFSFSRKRRCRIRSFPSLIRARGGAIAAFASVGGFLDDFGVCFCLL